MTALNALQQFQADQIAGQTNARMRITLDAMKQLAGYLSGIQGRKNVIWFSGSFPLTLLPEGGEPGAFANVETFREQVQQTADMLTAARVAIYPIDASGLWEPAEFSAASTPPIPSDINQAAQAQTTQWSQEREQHSSNQATMQELADETGGEPFFETNDFGKAVAGTIENGSSYYTLAYVPKNAAPDERSHNIDGQHGKPAAQYRKIQVRLDDDHGLKLAYRRGYYADATDKSSPPGSGFSGSYTSTSDLSGGSSVFAAALAPDAPAATAILLRARVLPATDPMFQAQNLVGLSAGPPRPAAPATRQSRRTIYTRQSRPPTRRRQVRLTQPPRTPLHCRSNNRRPQLIPRQSSRWQSQSGHRAGRHRLRRPRPSAQQLQAGVPGGTQRRSVPEHHGLRNFCALSLRHAHRRHRPPHRRLRPQRQPRRLPRHPPRNLGRAARLKICFVSGHEFTRAEEPRKVGASAPRSSHRERKKLAQDKPYPKRSEGEEQSWEKNQETLLAP